MAPKKVNLKQWMPGKFNAPLNPTTALKRLRKIKLLALDIDGVMTNTRIFWLKNQGWTREFSVRDGYAVLMLMKAGLEVAVISAGESEDVRARMERLKIKRAHFGNEDKLPILERILTETGISFEETAYIGDELMDIPVLEKVGFAATVPHAVAAVKKRVDYVTATAAGNGVVREVADAIRAAQGLGPYLET